MTVVGQACSLTKSYLFIGKERKLCPEFGDVPYENNITVHYDNLFKKKKNR